MHDFEERVATLELPYHFIESGLPNVYLIGITYTVCKLCNRQLADTPAIKKLMRVIARAVVESDAALTGLEIRFLRKRLGKKSTEFGSILGVGLKTLSRWENGHNPPDLSADKLIRILYSVLSGDERLRRNVDEDIDVWLAALTGDGQRTKIRARLRDRDWEELSL